MSDDTHYEPMECELHDYVEIAVDGGMLIGHYYQEFPGAPGVE